MLISRSATVYHILITADLALNLYSRARRASTSIVQICPIPWNFHDPYTFEENVVSAHLKTYKKSYSKELRNNFLKDIDLEFNKSNSFAYWNYYRVIARTLNNNLPARIRVFDLQTANQQLVCLLKFLVRFETTF